MQARPARKDEDEEETDDILDELLEAAARRKRGEAGDEAEADAEDEDLGTDDDPPEPPHSRRPLGLDSTRPPEARVPIIKRDKPPLPVADFAASFQDAAVEILVDKTVSAAAAYQVRTVLLAGGVAANLRLRERLQERLGPDIVLRSPPPILCTDNAAMVAAAAYFRYDAGLQHDWTLDIDPNARYME